jgi:ubiquinone/menaquinone biosynthesis C-methylase UbiE
VAGDLSVDPEWWRSFFGEDYLRIARAGDSMPDTAAAMVDFLVDRLELGPATRVLDLACGHGRHTLELARRGIPVVGLDYSEPSLAAARATAEAEGLQVELVRADMREIPFPDESFAAVANLFAAFGYFDDEADNQRVLSEIARVLVPGGRLLLETISPPGLFPRFVERNWSERPDGALLLEERRYDAVRGRNDGRWILIEPTGERKVLEHSARLYTAPELIALLERAGLTFGAAYGDYQGADYDRMSRRLIVVASRSAPTEMSSTASV